MFSELTDLARLRKRWAPKPSLIWLEKALALEGWTRLGSPSALAKCGGQGASPRPSASSRAARSRRASSEPACVDVGVGVAEGGEALRHGEDGEVGGVGVGDLGPGEGGGDAGVGQRADGVGGGGGAVLGVLVVVEKDAVALFLPPLGGGQGRDAAFDGAGEGEGGAADLGEGPLRVDGDVDVDAAGAGGLGKAAEAVLVEHGFDFQGDQADVGEAMPGWGSRSMRSWSGWSRSPVRTGWGWSSMQPRLTIQASAAALSTTTSSAVRPEGKERVTVRTKSGRLSGARFW